MAENTEKSYLQVLKSSALVGASSLVNLALRVIRTKVIALLLGPAGVGLLGMYDSIGELARSLAGLGVNTSGVRQIAEAAGSGDVRRISRTVTTLRRVAFCSGLMGALLLFAFRNEVSRVTFGDERHAGSVALLAMAVFFADISAAQGALVQGMRRISDLARINVLGALYGTLFSVPIVWFYGEKGLVPSLVCVAAMTIVTSWWYARKIRIEPVKMTLLETIRESSELLKLGFVFMASGLFTVGSAYLVRLAIMRQLGIDAAGYYQAAWAIGGLYVGFILQAMGADFYPRLTAVANDNEECNRLINEQAEVGMLIGATGLLATLVFAPLVMELFYSGRFGPAAEILRWICLGMLIRVACWPVGFLVLAKGRAKIFFWAELLSNAALVAMVWISVQLFGIVGAGAGFFGMYVLYGFGIYMIARNLSGFRWSDANRKLALYFVPTIGVVFTTSQVLPPVAGFVIGTAATLITGAYSLKMLCALIPVQRFPAPVRGVLRRLRLIEIPASVW